MTLGELVDKLQELEVSSDTPVWVLGGIDHETKYEPSVFMMDEEVVIG